MTIAQTVAESLGNDGQRFTTRDGLRPLEPQAWDDRRTGVVYAGERNIDGGYYRINYRDGSAIVVQDGYCWDFAVPGSGTGDMCFEGEGHTDDRAEFCSEPSAHTAEAIADGMTRLT